MSSVEKSFVNVVDQRSGRGFNIINIKQIFIHNTTLKCKVKGLTFDSSTLFRTFQYFENSHTCVNVILTCKLAHYSIRFC